MDMLKDKFVKRVLFLIALAVLVWLLWALRSIFVYMAIASVLGLMASPAVNFLERLHFGRFHIPNVVNVLLVMVLMIALVAGVLALIVPLVSTQADNLSLFDAAKAKENALLIYHNIINALMQYGVIQSPPELTTDYIRNMDFSFITKFLDTVVSSLGSLFTMLFAVVFFMFFFLKERHRASSFILSIVPDNLEKNVSDMMEKTRQLLSRYILGLVAQQTTIFVFTLILLLGFGIQNPIIIAFFVALINIIPYIGPLLGGTLLVSLSMLSNLSMPINELVPTTLWILAGFIGIQLFDNFVTQPVVLSTSVKAHPLEIFTVTLAGGILFGIVGMIVAVPSYTILRIIAKEFFWDSKLVRAFTRNI